MVAGLFLLSASFPLAAEQSMSREDYVLRSHDDLLAPCRNEGFARCLGTSSSECEKRVNQLVTDCSGKLPATITEKNFDASAGDYVSCIFAGLQKSFNKSSEEIGDCENRAGFR
jgi:hypothetical protein